jgi:hypothetical protein
MPMTSLQRPKVMHIGILGKKVTSRTLEKVEEYVENVSDVSGWQV